MNRLCTLVFFTCWLTLAGVGPCALASAAQDISWRELEPGLAIARLTLAPLTPPGPTGQPADPAPVTILRIDPARFTFSLYMASERGQKPLTAVAQDDNLVAAINAGMYLPDKSTSTGYLRNATHTNNRRIAGNFGAFFMAGPKTDAPPALLLDRDAHDWEKLLAEYDLVMQNYRMSTPDGRVIWKQAERLHSVAALAQDDAGTIFFILCPNPVQAADFVAALLQLPLRLGGIMYLEGGSEAALLVRAGGEERLEVGRHPINILTGGAGMMLPNILGVKRRPPQTQPGPQPRP